MLNKNEDYEEQFSADELDNKKDEEDEVVEVEEELEEQDVKDLKDEQEETIVENTTQQENHMNMRHNFFMMENVDLNFTSSFYSHRQLEVEGLKNILNKDSNHGLTGIKNLGNTCYISTVLQCLSHSLELTYFFLAKLFSSEINKAIGPSGNQLIKRGLKPGNFSNTLYKALYSLWINSDKQIAPSELKLLIANSIGSGLNTNNQQDAHEMLIYLLDFIHEDLNSAQVVPGSSRFNEDCLAKMDNESDISASKRFWNYYRERNNSIIVDLFTGQLKSTIECAACDSKNVTFEAFLTLPLAIPNMKRVEVIVVPAINIKSTIKITLYVSESALFIDLPMYLKKYLHPDVKVDRFRCLLVNGRSHTAKCTRNSENIFVMSKKGFIFAYEIDERIAEGEENYPFITLVRERLLNDAEKESEKEKEMQKEKEKKEKIELPENKCFMKNIINFSYPRLFPMPNLSTVKELRLNLYGYMRKYYSPSKTLLNIIFSSDRYSLLSDKYTSGKLDSIDETEYDTIIKDEYNFLFNSNSSHSEQSEEILKLKEDYLNNMPYEVVLVSSKDEFKSKLFFSGRCDEFNKTISDTAKIEKLIDIIKTGCKLVIEVRNNEELRKAMNSVKSVTNKDKEMNYSKIPTIDDCLDHFSLTEKMDKGNEWYCNKCRKLQTAFKKLELFYVPKNLIIVLNRFVTKLISKFSIQILKNNTLVKYPVNGLNLNDSVRGTKDPKPIYDLYSVSQHSGSVEGGHYATASRNFGKWYEFDDLSIFSSDEDLIVSPEGYILFFRRQEKKSAEKNKI